MVELTHLINQIPENIGLILISLLLIGILIGSYYIGKYSCKFIVFIGVIAYKYYKFKKRRIKLNY